jgi:hypothetical protein
LGHLPGLPTAACRTGAGWAGCVSAGRAGFHLPARLPAGRLADMADVTQILVAIEAGDP